MMRTPQIFTMSRLINLSEILGVGMKERLRPGQTSKETKGDGDGSSNNGVKLAGPDLH